MRIVERFHRTLLDEYFRVEGRRTWFEVVEEMKTVLDEYIDGYNRKRPHQVRGMNGRTPARAFVEGLPKLPSAANAAETARSNKKKEKTTPETETQTTAI